MTRIYLIRLFILLFSSFSFSAYAQLSGTKTIPGDYATIAAAITDLNTVGVAAPGVTFDVAAGHTETGVVPVVTATGTAAAPIVFQKSGIGANPLVVAGTGTGTLDGIIRLSGTDYITFDAIDLQENAANTTTATQMEWGYALLKASATNASQNVTIKNSTITLNKTNTASTGIYVANHTPAVVTALVITDVAGASSNNKFYGNTISNVYHGIRVIGYGTTTLTTYHDQNNEIGMLGAGNLVTNFGGSTVAANGIYTIYQENLKVIGNTINGGNGTANILQGIHNDVAASASAQISNNTITIHGGGTTQAVRGIHNQAGATAASNTITISNNSVLNSTYPTATSGTFTGILNTAGAAVVNITDNTVSNFSYSGTGLVQGIQNSSFSATPVNINGNTVSAITRTAASGIIYGVQAGTGLITFNNNNVFNINQSGTSVMYGYYNNGSPTQEILTGNSIYNLTSTGTGTVSGIFTNSTAAGVRTIALNQVYGLSTAGTTIYGFFGATANTNTLNRNKFADITSNSTTTASVYGVYISTGNSFILNNNLIANLAAPAATGLTAVNGVQIAGGTTHELNYNTIYLNASSSASGDFGSNGVYVSSTTATVTLRNNLIVNKSTPKGVARTVALRVPNTSQIGANSNNNLYYAGTPSAVNVIYFDGITFDATLAEYKARVTPKEKRSVTEDPNFLSLVSSSPDFLRPNPSVPTKIESGAIEITGITDDYYTAGIRTGYPKAGQVNGGGFKPDIGAVEGDYTIFPITDVGITALAAPSLPLCTDSTETVTFTLSNLATSPIDFSLNPVTIESFAINPAGDTTFFSTIVRNSGTMPGSSSEPITVSVSYNMFAPGTYKFHGWATTPDDNENTNDSLVPPKTITIGPGTTSASDTDICAGKSIVLTLTGQSGTIQWQSSTDSVTFANETGAGSNSASYTVSPTTSTWYRAVVCGNMISDTVLVNVTFVPAPVASDVTRCGEGTVTITAASSYPVTWYDAPVGGNKVDTGLVITPYVTTSTSFYAEATTGGIGNVNTGRLAPQAGGATNLTTYGQVFTITENITLNSVNVISTTGTSITVSLYNSSGTAQLKTTGAVTVPTNDTSKIILNWDLAPGTYRLIANGMTGNFIRENSTVTYPIPLSSIGEITGFVSSITGTVTTSSSYYWFYKWNISSGCTSDREAVFVSVTAAPPIFAATSDTLICEGDSVTLTVASTNSDYTYTWSPNNGLSSTTGDTVTATPDSTMYYFVNAIDPTGCEALDSVMVEVNPFAPVSATATDSSICAGDTVQLNVIDGSLNYVQVGNGTITNSATTYPAPYGNYYWGSKHQMLIRASELVAAGMVPGPISSLAFDVVSINNSFPLEDFTIKIGQTTQTAMTTTFATIPFTTVFYQASYMPVNGQNTHNFTTPFVWDGVSNIIIETCFNNSSFDDNATLRQTNAGFNATLYRNADNATVCTAVATGTTSTTRPNMVFVQKFQMAYSWSPSTGLSNDTIVNPFAAPDTTTTYQVTVTHPISGCTRTSSVTIDVNPEPDVTFSVSDISCNNSNDGSISFVQNSGTPVTFVWAHDPAETSDSLTGLSAGNYILTITNPDNGCKAVLDTTLVNPAPLDLTINSTDATCFGTASGSANVSVAGGTPAYTYSWNTSPVQTAATATNLSAGNYEVLVTDAHGCTKTASTVVNEPAQIVINSGVTNIACFGGGFGSIFTASSGGTGNYTFTWSHDASNTTSFADSLTAGSYTFTVTDANNCTESEVFQITEPAQITGTVSVQNETCKDLDNGQATVTVAGGSGFYNIIWNTTPVQAGPTASNLSPGVYSVVITDSEGCSITRTATIGEGAVLSVTVTVQDETCKDLNNGQATVTATGGSGFYNIIWNTTPVQVGTTASNLSPGVYSAQITDSEGCSASGNATIGEGGDKPVAGFNYTAITSNQFSFTSTSTGETSWIWSFGDSTVSTLQNPVHTYTTAGNYTVTLMVTNDCGSHFVQQQIISTGIAENNLISGLEIFPNPTANSFTVKFTGQDIGNMAVRLMSHTGQVIRHDKMSNFAGAYNQRFDLSDYASGMYTLQIITDNGVVTRKIVLTR